MSFWSETKANFQRNWEIDKKAALARNYAKVTKGSMAPSASQLKSQRQHIEPQLVDAIIRIYIAMTKSVPELSSDHTEYQGDPHMRFSYTNLVEGNALSILKRLFEVEQTFDLKEFYLFQPLMQFLVSLGHDEMIFQPLPRAEEIDGFDLEQRIQLDARLLYLSEFVEHWRDFYAHWNAHMMGFLEDLLKTMPMQLQTAPFDDDPQFTCMFIDACHDPHEQLCGTLSQFLGEEYTSLHDYQLFSPTHKTLYRLALQINGVSDESVAPDQLDHPNNYQDRPASALVETFFGETAFTELYLTPVPHAL